jgi:hypothetical protein
MICSSPPNNASVINPRKRDTALFNRATYSKFRAKAPSFSARAQFVLVICKSVGPSDESSP